VKTHLSTFNSYDFLTVPILVIDEKSCVSFWNKTLEYYTNIARSEILGKNIFEHYPHLDTHLYRERIANVVTGGMADTFTKQFHQYFIPITQKNNRYKIQKTIASPVRVEGQGKYGIFAIFDETESDKKLQSYKTLREQSNEEIEKRIIAEENYRSSMHLLQRSNDELNEFANAISHDLKAPLRGVGSLIDFIWEDNKEKINEESKSNFELIKNRISQMDEMVNGLLQYAMLKTDNEDIEDVDLNKVIESLKLLLVVNDDVLITLKYQLPIVKINRHKIHQVLQNLISNAIHHNDKETCLITIDYAKEGARHIISVIDNGKGISEDKYDLIFSVFKSFGVKGQNHGLGLAIVKKIIVNYGGEIWVDSELGKGSKFSFSLPCS